MARPERPEGRPLVEEMGPPLARLPWSPDFALQTLEVLPLWLAADGFHWLKPVHAASLQVGLPRAAAPADMVLEVLGWYPLAARVVHSTSWRLGDGRVILTYAVAIDEPGPLPPDSLVGLPVERAELARGGSTSAPGAIATAAVIEHALRHLAWLVADDAAIAAALPDWVPALLHYGPEPFRPL